MKRIVTIQDISCIGKCSITAALPIISAMGVETAILPTAVLSTHTMFKEFTFKNLEDQILPIRDHWKKKNFHFDAIYTAYLASKSQIALIQDFVESFRTPETLFFVDPVMADKGKLYPGFTEDFPAEMAQLAGMADIIVPNPTEACLLTGMEYREDLDEDYARKLLEKLARLGVKKYVVITGTTTKKGEMGISGMDVQTGEFFGFSHERVDATFHGTGDVFASCVVGALENGWAVKDAFQLGADFTIAAIKATLANEHDRKKPYGVDFESVLPYLMQKMGRIS